MTKDQFITIWYPVLCKKVDENMNSAYEDAKKEGIDIEKLSKSIKEGLKGFIDDIYELRIK